MKVGIIGLGFVGLSLAAFLSSKNVQVTGIDTDKTKIQNYSKRDTAILRTKSSAIFEKSN